MLKNIYNQTVTILNKLKREDNDGKMDLWYKTVLNDVVWYADSARSAGNHDVYIGRYITVLIPFHNEYVDYLDWRGLRDKENYYTMSMGDYVIQGLMPEEVDASNIVKTLQKYGERVCLVRHHNTNYDRFGATVQLKVQGV